MDIESETEKIEMLIQKGNLHAAFNIALSGVNHGKRQNDQVCIEHFLKFIRVIAQLIETGAIGQHDSAKDHSDRALCIICGVAKNTTQLYSGANGSICKECAKQAVKHFS